MAPPEPAPPQDEKARLPHAGAGAESKEEAGTQTPSSPSSAAAPVTGLGPPSKDEALANNGTGSTPTKAEGAAKDEDKKGAAKPDGKKDKLGFFTSKKPVDVVSDTMEAFEKGKTIVFNGNVVAKQEGSEPGQTLFLFSDKLTAYQTDESSDIQKAVAEGNVKVVKAERTATCKQAFFYNDKGEVVLKGDVVVYEGNDRLTGDTATYYLNEDRVFVQGDTDKRAHVTVTPKK